MSSVAVPALSSSRPPARRRRWPRVLTVAAVLVLVPLLGAAGLVTTVWVRADVQQTEGTDFTRPLAIPPLAPSRLDERGRRVFMLTAQQGRTDFGRTDGGSGHTETWGIDGSYLGPTLRATRGEQVVVHVRNTLGEPTSLHWHGMHLPARMDGGPHQSIAQGATWSPTWRIDQPAATLWYHPHLHGETARQVYRGLAGMFILDDDASGVLPLPRTYGVDDLPVIVQDKSFSGNGQLNHGGPLVSPTGFRGRTMLVNGVVTPHVDVRTERVRLRLLNASDARVYDFGLDDGSAFDLVGTDGGLLEAPVTSRRVQLSPGERAEVVVTLRPGEHRVLRSFPPELGADFFNERFNGGDDTFDLMQLRAADALRPSPAVPARLVPAPDLKESAVARTREFRLSGTDINGRGIDMTRVDEVATVGDTEVWKVSNDGGTPHSFHVHDVQFRVLDIDGQRPQGHLGGWKDTVYVAPGRTVRLLLRFADYTDPAVPYMFHCHLLRHEDNGMMGQFVVVRPGEQPSLAHQH